MIRILIADNHAVVRAGVRQLLAEMPDMQLDGEAVNGDEALALARDGQWDVMLLDIAMPGQSGIDVLRQLKRWKPELPVLIFSVCPEDQYAVSLLRAGASGYVSKDSEPEELVLAIRRVAQGRRYVSPALGELLAMESGGEADKPLHESLSQREFEIFRKLASGASVSEIAAELCLSAKTVSTHRTRLLEKMRMKNNADLTAYSIRNRLME